MAKRTKGVNHREISIIDIAISEALDNKDYQKNGPYAILGEEMFALRKKLHTYKTKAGNYFISDWQGYYGWSGAEYKLMDSWYNKGYQTLYNEADYNWGVVSIEEMKIFTYCEGDTSLVECKTKDKFIAELKSYIEFLGKDDGYTAKKILKEVEKC